MKRLFLSGLVCLSLLPLTACANPTASNSAAPAKTFTTGAIPDQDPEKLQRLYSKLAKYLEAELKVPVAYKPVTDYTAAVTAFKVGDIDMVWFGGLTGVQARLQVPGADALAQRDIDPQFHSVFIVNKASGIAPFTDAKDLAKLKGRTFTFGSESSTSGRLMPQHFLQQAGIKLEDFKGQAGFSKNHDATIELVTAGTYEAGALNEQVWRKRLSEGKIDTNKVQVVWRSPAYFDYHWVINPSVREKFGPEFEQKVLNALIKLNPNNPEHQEILELFGAAKFIPTKNENYATIEKIGREVGKIK
jgi:phosphonate transport system substrate-binding protein